MKLQGEHAFEVSREKVWEALNNPAVIARCLPGCESLVEAGGGIFRAVLKIGIGPVKGTYTATLEILDQRPPQGYTLRVDGSGTPGFVKGEGKVELEEQGGHTVLRYAGDLQIGGLVARIGQRLIGTISQQMTSQFFARLGEAAGSGAGRSESLG